MTMNNSFIFWEMPASVHSGRGALPGTTQTSRAWGAPPTDSVLEPELDTPQSQVKGGWLLLVCHFLDALQTF